MPKTEDILAEVRDVRRGLESLLEEVALAGGGGTPDEFRVWRLYARTEKSVAILKFRLDYESPGVFMKLPTSKRPLEFLREAAKLLSTAEGSLSRQQNVESLRHMRNARNNLRAYLTEMSRLREREMRARRRNASGPAKR